MSKNIGTGRRAAGLLAALGTTAALAAGCGGSDSGGPAGSGPVPPTAGASLSVTGAGGVAVTSSASKPATTAQKAKALSVARKAKSGFTPQPNKATVRKAAPRVHATRHAPVKARGVEAPSHEVVRRSKSSGAIVAGAAKANPATSPCKLVTRSEAAAILKKSVTMTLAPQGPTCIYRATGSKSQIAMSVQRVGFATIKKTGRIISQQKAGSHTIFCVKYGTTSTYVPLSSTRLLNVTGSCATGAKFARKALSRL